MTKHAASYEEIKPLIGLCRAGRLFEVQNWISEGKPVSLPPPENMKRAKASPLQVALELGFYSLAQLLLENGASLDESHYLLSYALHKRRLDFVELLLKHGADMHCVPMDEVFDTWSREIVEFFIARGADLISGNPIASALCSRVRPALGIYMQYRDKHPALRDQVDIALRHHCKEGNLKWVSLLLWAGADPNSRGPDSPFESDPESFISALEVAALYGHGDIFKLKKLRFDPASNPEDLMWYACLGGKAEILKLILEKGFSPKDLQNNGSTLIQLLIQRMGRDFDYFSHVRKEKDIDSYKSRDLMKMLHMLVRHGARWEPGENREINTVRRSLLKMRDDYAVEFIWIMSEYRSCRRSDLETLVRPPTMRLLISRYSKRVDDLIRAA